MESFTNRAKLSSASVLPSRSRPIAGSEGGRRPNDRLRSAAIGQVDALRITAERRLLSAAVQDWPAVFDTTFSELSALRLSLDLVHFLLISIVNDVSRIAAGDQTVQDLCAKLARTVLGSADDSTASAESVKQRWDHLLHEYLESHLPEKQAECYVRSARVYMSAHYSEPLTSKALANQLGCPRKRFAAIYRRVTGSTVREGLIDIRLSRAIDLLKAGVKVEAVAPAVGFRSRSAFFVRFKQRTGLTPAAFRALQSAHED